MTTTPTAMPTPRPALLTAALLALVLTACGGDEATAPGVGNALLDYVPADTPYLAANLDTLPEDVADAYLKRAQPVLDEIQAQLTAARADLERSAAGGSGEAFESRLARAILRELDGKLSREGLESLGVDVLAHKVTYGVGAFPVIRTGLADAAVLRATIQRILDGAGVTAPEETLQGVRYWRVEPEVHGSDMPGVPIALYVSILDDHLAVGVLPAAREAEVLPAFLGLERPARSDAGAALAELNRANDYTNYGSGFIDTGKLADEFLQPDRLTAGVMAELGAYDAAALPTACVEETYAMLENVPRMTAGTTELSEDAIAYQYRLETPPTLAGRLRDLVARVPAADALSDRILDLAFGMRFGAVRDFLREKAQAIVQNPYRCEHFQELNARAEAALARLDQPMPPFANNFRGLRVSLDEIIVSGGGLPAGARGHLALHVAQPEMFLGMAQMFLPNLANLGLKSGGPPVRLPEDLFPVPGVVAFAAMSDDAIGVSLGEGEESGLEDYLDRDAGPEGMFLSVSYDTAAYLEFAERLAVGEKVDAVYSDGDEEYATPGAGRSYEGVQAVAEAARQAFREMADRSLTTFRFTPEGLVVDGRMTFQPLP